MWESVERVPSLDQVALPELKAAQVSLVHVRHREEQAEREGGLQGRPELHVYSRGREPIRWCGRWRFE